MSTKIQQQLIISLDYEVFFGSNTGSVEKCLITPTNEIVKVLDKYGAKLCLFVDAGYLAQLEKQSSQHPQLGEDLKQIENQLKKLTSEGHEIQLHIHPHWEDCKFTGSEWEINTDRYRLHDFEPEEQIRIVGHYKRTLEKLTDSPIFAYRAGGWCIQPFEQISDALKSEDIWLDSTVYEHGVSEDPIRWFDFRECEQRPMWQFQNNPAKLAEDGFFTEIPISAMPVNPIFYWIDTLMKKLFKQKYAAFGDGSGMVANKGYYLTRLTRKTFSPVSLDGGKAGLLEHAYKYHLKRQDKAGVFNVMGHPKAMSPYSIEALDNFLGNHKELQSITFQELKHFKAAQD